MLAGNYPDLPTMKKLHETVYTMSNDTRRPDAINQSIGVFHDLLLESYDVLREENLGACLSLTNLLVNAGVAKPLFEQEVLRTCDRLKARLDSIDKQLRLVDVFKMPDVAEQLARVQASVEELEATQGENTTLLDERREQKRVLDEVIQVLQQPSAAQIVKRALLPTADEVDTIVKTFKNPVLDVDLIKAALAKLDQNVALLDQGRKLSGLIKTRNQIEDALTRLVSEQGRVQRLIEEAREQKEALAKVGDLNEWRTEWLAQASRLRQSWAALLETLKSPMEDSEQAAKAMLDYLMTVRRSFEKG